MIDFKNTSKKFGFFDIEPKEGQNKMSCIIAYYLQRKRKKKQLTMVVDGNKFSMFTFTAKRERPLSSTEKLKNHSYLLR